MTTTHAITFTGELLDGFERAEVMARFAARFGLKGAQVDKVFCGQPVTLKKGLDEAKARAYVKALNELGMRTVSSSPFDVTEDRPTAGYSILFDGSVVAGYDREAVKRSAAEKLKFSDAQRNRLFSGSEVTMKRGLDEEKARHYAKTLRQLGMNARVEPPLPEPATAAAPPAEPTPPVASKPEPKSTPEPAPTPAAAADARSTTAATPASAADTPADTAAAAPAKRAKDPADAKKLSDAEASLMVTQFSPAPAYDLENTFHSSSTLDAASIGDDGDDTLHEALRESPLAKPMPPDAKQTAETASPGPDTASKNDMMATMLNADALKDYEDALADDKSIEALRAAHDPAPRTKEKTTPEAAADALKAAAEKTAAATSGIAGADATAKAGASPDTAKVADQKAAEKVDRRDAASPVHEQDTVLAELPGSGPVTPKTPETKAPEPESKGGNHTVLIVLIVIAAVAAAWFLMQT